MMASTVETETSEEVETTKVSISRNNNSMKAVNV